MTASLASPAVVGADARRPRRGGRNRTIVLAIVFLAPAIVLLGALVVYPILYTLWRSFYSASGGEFVGVDNYVTMFTDPDTFTAIRNNFIWVIVAPIACTALGLVFAVLLDRIRWATAFKLIIFMPMAISMLAAGVIFRTVFQENPQVGVANAIVVAVRDAFTDTAAFPGARERPDAGVVARDGALSGAEPVMAGGSQGFPLIGIRQSEIPETAKQAAEPPHARAGEITGTVWLDLVRGGGGTNGHIDPGKKGLPGLTVQAVDSSGAVVASATTADDGTYRLTGLDGGRYTVTMPASNFTQGASGIPWLGPSLINVVVISSYIWIWAGFAMIMIASGLSALDRSLQEAARVDGATEWQVFRRITAPLLMPVLVVVFVTLIINVLKIFDLVYVIPPGESKPAANVIAVEMWNVSFGGGNNQGLGSALAILLLVLVLPSMILNVRRFRRERER